MVEAARDELLIEFYGSHLFGFLLGVVEGRTWEAVLAENGPSGIVQRALRSAVPPPGLSLHRRDRHVTKSALSSSECLFPVRLVLFKSTLSENCSRHTEVISSVTLSVSATGECTECADIETEDLTELIPFLLPVHSVSLEVSLFSYVVARKNAANLYGSSLVLLNSNTVNLPTKTNVLLTTIVEEDLLDAEPILNELAIVPVGSVDDSVEVYVDPMPMPTAPPNIGEHSLFSSILERNHHSSQTLSRMTDGAGQLLRDMRNWGELTLPPVIRVPSLSSLRSFSATTPNTEPFTPLTPSFWELGSSLSSAWMRPPVPSQLPEQVHDDEEESLPLWESEAHALPQLFGEVTGAAILSTCPAIQAMREPLRSIQKILSDCSETAPDCLPEIIHTLSASGVMQKLATIEHRRGASDFGLEPIFEVLNAQHLVTIFCAALVRQTA